MRKNLSRLLFCPFRVTNLIECSAGGGGWGREVSQLHYILSRKSQAGLGYVSGSWTGCFLGTLGWSQYLARRLWAPVLVWGCWGSLGITPFLLRTACGFGATKVPLNMVPGAEVESFFFFSFLIVDVQCSVNFCCIAKWPSYTYIGILFLILSFITFHHK